ncbi:hypothetical protein ACVW17_007123 [Bradyrhizobium sp. USDA 4473]
MGQVRRRVKQTNLLKKRLIKRAKELRDQAAMLAPGIAAETGAPGLRLARA